MKNQPNKYGLREYSFEIGPMDDMTRSEFHENLVNKAPESLDELADFLRSLLPHSKPLFARHWRVSPGGHLTKNSWVTPGERTDSWFAVRSRLRSRLMPPKDTDATWFDFLLTHDGRAECTVCNSRGLRFSFTMDTLDETRDILAQFK